MYDSCFFIYKSKKNSKFYWRLKAKRTRDSKSYEIIATGHQKYDSRQEAEKDIRLVKEATPNTTIYFNEDGDPHGELNV